MSDGTPPKATTVAETTRYLSAPEAAHYLRISLAWLRKATRKRDVPSFKIGARVVYDRVDLDAYVEERKRETAWAARS